MIYFGDLIGKVTAKTFVPSLVSSLQSLVKEFVPSSARDSLAAPRVFLVWVGQFPSQRFRDVVFAAEHPYQAALSVRLARIRHYFFDSDWFHK